MGVIGNFVRWRTDRQTDIATTRLNWPWGRFNENHFSILNGLGISVFLKNIEEEEDQAKLRITILFLEQPQAKPVGLLIIVMSYIFQADH